MNLSRRRKGFERAGSIRAIGLGLRHGVSRRIDVALAWRRTAGEALSDGVEVRLSRGLLDVVVPPGAYPLIEPVIGEIVARIAAEVPGLRIVKWRLAVEGDPGPRMPTVAVAPPTTTRRSKVDRAAGSSAGGGAARSPKGSMEVASKEALLERLESVRSRYLERTLDGPRPATRRKPARDQKP